MALTAAAGRLGTTLSAKTPGFPVRKQSHQ
jgi:hypothetical protein